MPSEEHAALAAARADLAAEHPRLAASLDEVLADTWQPESQHASGVPDRPNFRTCDIDTGATMPIVDIHVLYAVPGDSTTDGERLEDLAGVLHADLIRDMTPHGLCLHNATNGARTWFWVSP